MMITGWSMVLSSSALPCLACSFQDIHTHDSLPPAYSDGLNVGHWEQSKFVSSRRLPIVAVQDISAAEMGSGDLGQGGEELCAV